MTTGSGTMAVRLRLALLEGDLLRARQLTAQMGAVDGDLALAFRSLIEGIEHVRAPEGANAADRLLEELSSVQASSVDVRWLAWLWRATGLVRAKRLDVAKTAADLAQTIARQLDPASQAMTLALRAAVGSLQGDLAPARARMAEAASLIAHDSATLARLWLFWGYIMLATGRLREGLRALGEATLCVRQPWACMPLARQALLARRTAEAADILYPVVAESSEPGEDGACLLALIEDLLAGRLATEVVGEYFWTTCPPLTSEAVAVAESLVEDHRGYPRLRLVLAWDLAHAGFFERSRGQLRLAVERSADPALQGALRRSLAAIEALEPRWHQGVLEVVKRAAWAISGRRCYADVRMLQDGEIFWIRRAIGAGDLDRAQQELAWLEDLDAALLQHERYFLRAVRSGRIPTEVAREYVWIAERLLTEDSLGVLQDFVAENRAVEPLWLVLARDLMRDGFQREARERLQLLAAGAQDAEVQELARRDLASLAPLRPSIEVPLNPVDLTTFVNEPLRWPSVLDAESLLFCGPLADLPPAVGRLAETVTLAAGELLHEQGGRGEILYLVHHGEICGRRRRGEAEQTFGPFAGGVFLGEVGTLYGLPNTATLTATAPSEVGVVHRRSLRYAAERAGTMAVMETLRDLYWDTALHLSLLNSRADEDWLWRIARAEGRSRIFRPGEEISLEPETPLAMVISGVGRVVAAEQSSAVLGFIVPGDLALAAAPRLFRVRAEMVLSLAVVTPADLEGLSPSGMGALDAYVERCMRALRRAGLLTAAELERVESLTRIEQRLRALSQVSVFRPH